MAIICFDAKGWLAPPVGDTRVTGSEKMPNNRLRQDINQISLETIHTHRHTDTHMQCFLPEPQCLSHQASNSKIFQKLKHANVITTVEK